MANGPAHQLVAALTVGSAMMYDESRRNEKTATPLAGAVFAAMATKLPDVLEPPHHPHHRQFCHSWLFAAGLGVAIHQLHQWQPNDEWKKSARLVLLVSGYAYLIHLAMDAVTARSLPLIGKT